LNFPAATPTPKISIQRRHFTKLKTKLAYVLLTGYPLTSWALAVQLWLG